MSQSEVTDNQPAGTEVTGEAVCNGISTEETAVQEFKEGGQEAETPGKSLNTIQEMLTKLNSEISDMKTKVNTENTFLKQAQEELHGNSESEKQSKPKFDLDAMRQRTEQLRNEIRSIKTAQEMRAEQIQEQKALKAQLMNQFEDTNNSLNTETEQVNGAPEAQDASSTSEPNGSIDDIKSSIAMLKEQMDSILQQPIAPIISESDVETSEQSDESSVGVEGETSVGVDGETDNKSVEGQDTQDGQKESAEGDKPQNINAKAQDDLLKRFLLLKVMKENLAALSEKMNNIVKTQGRKSAQCEESKAEEISNQSEQRANVEVAEKSKQEMNQEKTVDENDEQANDDYFMYEDGVTGDEDLYIEDENHTAMPSGDKVGTNSQVEHVSGEKECTEEEPHDTSTAEETVQENNSQSSHNDPEIIDGNTQENVAPNSACVEKDKEDDCKTKEDEINETVLKARMLLQSKRALKGEASSTSQAQTGAENQHTSEAEPNKEADYTSSKIRTYYLLLKLQKEMAGMQIQLSKLQDNMRATNTALQTILEHEFSDMNN